MNSFFPWTWIRSPLGLSHSINRILFQCILSPSQEIVSELHHRPVLYSADIYRGTIMGMAWFLSHWLVYAVHVQDPRAGGRNGGNVVEWNSRRSHHPFNIKRLAKHLLKCFPKVPKVGIWQSRMLFLICAICWDDKQIYLWKAVGVGEVDWISVTETTNHLPVSTLSFFYSSNIEPPISSCSYSPLALRLHFPASLAARQAIRLSSEQCKLVKASSGSS